MACLLGTFSLIMCRCFSGTEEFVKEVFCAFIEKVVALYCLVGFCHSYTRTSNLDGFSHFWRGILGHVKLVMPWARSVEKREVLIFVLVLHFCVLSLLLQFRHVRLSYRKVFQLLVSVRRRHPLTSASDGVGSCFTRLVHHGNCWD